VKITLRHLEPGENDSELLILGASVGAVLTALAWTGSRLPLPVCTFHLMTGHACPTCGGTRSVVALLHGRVMEALSWNPLVCAGMVAMALLDLYAGWVLLARCRRVRVHLGRREARILSAAFVSLVAANWAYEVLRGV